MEQEIRIGLVFEARCPRGHTFILDRTRVELCPECEREDEEARAARMARKARRERRERRAGV